MIAGIVLGVGFLHAAAAFHGLAGLLLSSIPVPALLFAVVLAAEGVSEATIAGVACAIYAVLLFLLHRVSAIAAAPLSIVVCGLVLGGIGFVESIASPWDHVNAIGLGVAGGLLGLLITPSRPGTRLAHIRSLGFRIWLWPSRRYVPPHETLIGRAALPAVLEELVRAVVRRTRLRLEEKVDVATELIAHFGDGIDAGRTAEELAGSFGDPESAARLIRRAKKRCRGPLWHAWVWTARVVAGVFAVCVLAYVAQGVRFWTASPAISVDYVAEMDAIVEQRAAGEPSYEAWIEVWKHRPDLGGRIIVGEDEAGDPVSLRDIELDDLRPSARQALESAGPWLAEVRSLASSGRGFRWPHGVGAWTMPPSWHEFAALRSEGDSPPTQDELDAMREAAAGNVWSGSLVGILLPYLSEQRPTVQWLARDVHLAMDQGDVSRVVENLLAIIAIGEHAGEFPVLVNGLVQYTIDMLAFSLIRDVLATDPRVFNAEQLRVLAHRCAAPDYTLAYWMQGERFFMRDSIQRAYSDNGRGDGVLTADGIAGLTMFGASSSVFWDEGPTTPQQLSIAAIGPVAAALMPSRKETEALADQFFDSSTHRDPDAPSIDEFLESGPWWRRYRHPLIAMLMPALDHVRARQYEMEQEQRGILVAIALCQHFAEHGAWPASLDELVPHLLPSVPRDIFDGQPVRYRLTDAGPVLYSIGADHDDDGGTWPAVRETNSWRSHGKVDNWTATPNRSPSADGDWILFRLGEIDPPTVRHSRW
ncbi:MAG: hypothetical protein AAGI30_03975 [Planctomycetota bacterium]